MAVPLAVSTSAGSIAPRSGIPPCHSKGRCCTPRPAGSHPGTHNANRLAVHVRATGPWGCRNAPARTGLALCLELLHTQGPHWQLVPSSRVCVRYASWSCIGLAVSTGSLVSSSAARRLPPCPDTRTIARIRSAQRLGTVTSMRNSGHISMSDRVDASPIGPCPVGPGGPDGASRTNRSRGANRSGRSTWSCRPSRTNGPRRSSRSGWPLRTRRPRRSKRSRCSTRTRRSWWPGRSSLACRKYHQ